MAVPVPAVAQLGWHAAAGNPAFEDEFARVPPGRGAAPVNISGVPPSEWRPAAAALSFEHGRDHYSAVRSRRPALLDRSATGSTGGSNVNQRGAQLASVVEAVKTTKTT